MVGGDGQLSTAGTDGAIRRERGPVARRPDDLIAGEREPKLAEVEIGNGRMFERERQLRSTV